jgi:uncharacterized protein (UPF0333 family)
MRFLKIKLFTLLTLMLCMGVFGVTAYASDGGESLTVTAAWVDGELLRINVTDAAGAASSLALRLSDYVSDAENKEYISIQAVDLAGNKSGVIEIKNPYYVPESAPVETPAPEMPAAVAPGELPESDEGDIIPGGKPLTPDGAGSVVDNAEDGDGKEFFTVSTEDGSVFYLIIDRQKNADNVYLLNTVTEDDLIALAKENGRELPGASGTVTPEQTDPPTPSPEETPEPEPPAESPKSNDTGMYILIGIIVVVVGGAGYYFKIVRGRKNNDYSDEEDEDEDEAEDEYGYGEDDENTEDGGR